MKGRQVLKAFLLVVVASVVTGLTNFLYFVVLDSNQDASRTIWCVLGLLAANAVIVFMALVLYGLAQIIKNQSRVVYAPKPWELEPELSHLLELIWDAGDQHISKVLSQRPSSQLDRLLSLGVITVKESKDHLGVVHGYDVERIRSNELIERNHQWLEDGKHGFRCVVSDPPPYSVRQTQPS